MRARRWAGITGTCVALLLAGCGGGGSSGGSPTPSGAATGDVNALLSGNLASACAYVPPAVQGECRNGLGTISGLSAAGHYKIVRQVVQGNEALVALTGQVCLNGGNTGASCMSNSDASTGMPGGGTSFDAAFSTAVQGFNGSGGGMGPFSPVPCVEIDGRWYVDASKG